MQTLRIVVRMLPVGLLMVVYTHAACGQNYPNKPIRIVTSAIGGGNDLVARLVAQAVTGALGQAVIVDNRAAGILANDMVAKATSDGYTLLVSANSLWVLPLLQKVPYDPVRDFAPVTLAGSLPNILVVHPSLPVNSVKELIALAKTRPGTLNCASATINSSSYVAAELFRTMAGIDVMQITYKGVDQALNSAISGEVQMAFPNAASVTPHIKSGRVKALAVSSAAPSALAPGLPTIAASGVPGYEAIQVIGIFAPAKTPAIIINRLNQEIVSFLQAPEGKERFLNAGVEAVGSSPAELADKMKREISRLGRVVKDAGMHRTN